MQQTGMVQEAPEQDGRDAVEEPEGKEGTVTQCLDRVYCSYIYE